MESTTTNYTSNRHLSSPLLKCLLYCILLWRSHLLHFIHCVQLKSLQIPLFIYPFVKFRDRSRTSFINKIFCRLETRFDMLTHSLMRAWFEINNSQSSSDSVYLLWETLYFQSYVLIDHYFDTFIYIYPPIIKYCPCEEYPINRAVPKTLL